MLAEKNITALILCGGAGTRMGGLDKPLQMTQKDGLKLPMLDHVIATLPADVTFLISANRNINMYTQRGPVVLDAKQIGSGPLVGILAGLRNAQTAWLLVCPGDMPYLEQGWHEAIRQVAEKGTGRATGTSEEQTGALGTKPGPKKGAEKGKELDSVVIQGGVRLQPLLCLIRTSCADNLQAYLQSGEFSVHKWLESLHCATVSYKDTGQFLNINTLAELRNKKV